MGAYDAYADPCPWENFIYRDIAVLGYSVPSNPQYLDVTVLIPPGFFKPIYPRPGDQRIDVTFQAFITNIDGSNVNTAGFVSSELFMVNYGAFSVVNPVTPNNYGNSIPALGSFAPLPVLAAEAYDPTSLPVGGVNYPIWTRQTTGELETTIYADDALNPGSVWGRAFVQINGNIADPNAVTVTSRLKWAPHPE